MVFPEIAEAEAVQVAFMRGIAEGAEVGVMRRLDADAPMRRHSSVRNGGFRSFKLVEYLSAALEVAESFVRQCHTARGSM